jgi:hypothetical protein
MPTKTKTEKHTPGAIAAAEAITGAPYGAQRRYPTAYGDKTTEGIADIIDRKTAAPAMLIALEKIATWLISPATDRKTLREMQQTAKAAIKKAGA